jgi:hypothetical protein
MAGKKARGSWDSDDKRTKAGKAKSTYHPHKDTEAFLSLTGGLLKTGFNSINSKRKPKEITLDSQGNLTDKINSKGKVETKEELEAKKEKDKKSLPYVIGLAIIGLVLVVAFWVWVISIFI